MAKRTFQGDPRLVMGPNGTTLKFIGGQPVMDAGLENYILHRLGVKEGWVGNYLFPETVNQLGTDFEEVTSGAITMRKITDIEKAGERVLAKLVETGFAESISVEVSNPTGNNLDMKVVIKRPEQDAEILSLSRVNLVWSSQLNDPAHLKL